MNKMIIAEKPNVAEKIAFALADGKVEQKKNGQVKYYEIKKGDDIITVVSAVGHIFTLATKGKGYPVFDIYWAPSYSVSKSSDFTKKYADTIEKLAKNADDFVNACDFDLEGSLIGYNIIRFLCNSKDGKRIKFSTLTSSELREAYNNIQPLDFNNAIAGETRHILDWLWGINLSRAMMQAIKKAGIFKILSVGRVQGPALMYLVKKEQEISKFVPEPYWQIFLNTDFAVFNHIKDRFSDEKTAKTIFEKLKSPAIVENIEKTKINVPAPTPFDLTTLQISAYNLFGFKPTQTLEIAQTLYEASLISYPRTSSQQLPEKIGYKQILSDLARQKEYSNAKNILDMGPLRPNNGKKVDEAHPAIYPTGVVPQGLNSFQKKIYDLVVKRFMATFVKSAKLENCKVTLDANGEKFTAEGKIIIEPNWMEYYQPYVKLEQKEFPDLKIGQMVEFKPELLEKETKPPKRYTAATLIKKLENENLGTKATRAAIIETLYNRGYIADSSIRVTNLGMQFFNSLNKHSPEIFDEKMTREIEEKLELIQNGKENKDNVINDAKKMLSNILEKIAKDEKTLGEELKGSLKQEVQILGKCPHCGSNLRVMWSRYKKRFVGCAGYPNCKQLYPLPQVGNISSTNEVCKECNSPIIVVNGKKNFKMCLDPNCKTKENWGKKEKPAKKKKTVKKRENRA